jgi:hypothetical protein
MGWWNRFLVAIGARPREYMEVTRALAQVRSGAISIQQAARLTGETVGYLLKQAEISGYMLDVQSASIEAAENPSLMARAAERVGSSVQFLRLRMARLFPNMNRSARGGFIRVPNLGSVVQGLRSAASGLLQWVRNVFVSIIGVVSLIFSQIAELLAGLVSGVIAVLSSPTTWWILGGLAIAALLGLLAVGFYYGDQPLNCGPPTVNPGDPNGPLICRCDGKWYHCKDVP